MAETSFVGCKPRRRKKARNPPVAPPKEKKYCPRSFDRYDNTQTGYSTCWVCKMCKAVVLAESHVKTHMENCKENYKQMKAAEAKKIKKNCDLPSYICEVCNKVFTRNVVLKKHAEEHKPKTYDLDENEQEKNNSTKRVPKRKYVHSSLIRKIKQEPKNDLDNTTENTTFEYESKYVPPLILHKHIKTEPITEDDD